MEDLEPKYELSDTGFPVQEPVPYFAVMLREPNKIRLVNVGPELVRCVHERLEQLVPIETFGYVLFKDYQISFTGRFNIYDILLDKNYFSMNDSAVKQEDMTLIKVVFCRMLGALFCYGYDIVTASDVARDQLTHSTMFFRLRDPQSDYIPLHYYSHKFICVAPFRSDSILLINIPKITVEPILKTIHLTWSPGIKSKQTLADDDRSVSVVISLRLSGSPWHQALYNSGKSTIQARQIIVEVARILATYKWRYAVNINFGGKTDSFFFQWCPHLDIDEARYCAIILSRYDRLRLLQLPTTLIPVVKECVNNFWYLRLLKQREYHGTTEFKLGGCPWWADGNDAIESRYFISCLIGTLKMNGWEVCGTMDLSRHNNDKSTFLLKQCQPQMLAHMCISLSKTNRIRLIVSSSDISEESELQLTTRMNETIKQHWVALGPRNYGKSIEWKLEGDPWDTEGLYSDQTRGVYLLCLLLEVIQPLGWKLVSSADISSKNLDANERGYALMGKPEDLHTWFFLYDESLRKEGGYPFEEKMQQQQYRSCHDVMTGSTSVPNLDSTGGEPSSPPPPMGAMYDTAGRYTNLPTYPSATSAAGHYPECGSLLQQQRRYSRSVPSVAAVANNNGGVMNNMAAMQSGAQSAAGGDTYLSPNRIQQPQSHYLQTGSIYGSQTPHYNQYLSGQYQQQQQQQQKQQQQQQQQQGIYFNGGFRSQQQQQQQPCLANGRCQSRQRLMRQASAGSLPPDPSIYNPGSYHPGHMGHNAQHFGGFDATGDGGYRSDGEGYKSDGAYKQVNDPVMSRRGCRSVAGNYGSRQGGRKSNGYVSDGEGYVINRSMSISHTGSMGLMPGLMPPQDNSMARRVSKSGKFGGSQGHIFGNMTPGPPMDMNPKDSEDDEEDDDDVMGRADSRTPESLQDDEDDVDDDPNNIVSYSAFKAEAKAAASAAAAATAMQGNPSRRNTRASIAPGPGPGPGEGASSCEELYTVEVMETTTTVRKSNSSDANLQDTASSGLSLQNRRASSRTGHLQHSSSDRSDSQMGGYGSGGGGPGGGGPGKAGSGGDTPSGRSSRMRGGGGGGGYRSEGSNESPMHSHGSGSQQHQLRQQQMASADMIEVASDPQQAGSVPLKTKSKSIKLKPQNHQQQTYYAPQPHPQPVVPQQAQSQYQHLHTARGSNRHHAHQVYGTQAPPPASKSLNSFERQESTASFQSGQSMYSTHSAPPLGGVSVGLAPGGAAAGPFGGGGPPLQHLQQHRGSVSVHHLQPHFGQQQPGHLQHPGNHQLGLESCSTQSSSSSASAPPDYASCSGGGPVLGGPPTYDQALTAERSQPPMVMKKTKKSMSISAASGQTRLSSMGNSLSLGPNPALFQHRASSAGLGLGGLGGLGTRQKPPPLRSQQQVQQQQQQQVVGNPMRVQPQPGPPQPQPQGNRHNELYYMGEFYG